MFGLSLPNILSTFSQYEDYELFGLIAESNAGAYRQLYENYFQRLYAAALMYTKVPEQAEDIVQGVFLKVWEKRAQLAGIEKPKNWLFILARNEIMNGFRRQSVHEGYIHHIKEVFLEEQSTPEDLLVLRQKDDILKKAVSLLPLKQKEAYLLSREKGLSYEKIATEMNISRNTVREHIAKALKSVRAFLVAHKDQFIMIAIGALSII